MCVCVCEEGGGEYWKVGGTRLVMHLTVVPNDLDLTLN